MGLIQRLKMMSSDAMMAGRNGVDRLSLFNDVAGHRPFVLAMMFSSSYVFNGVSMACMCWRFCASFRATSSSAARRTGTM